MFDSAHRMLNGEMKRLRSIGLGVKTKRAEPISTEEENSLWEQGLLDAKFPQVLLDTMVFLCGMYFALRSVKEHTHVECYISVKLSWLSLRMHPPFSNTLRIFQRTTANAKSRAEQVVHHENLENPDGCLLAFSRSTSCTAHKRESHLLCIWRKPKSNIWCGQSPVGHNLLHHYQADPYSRRIQDESLSSSMKCNPPVSGWCG